MVGNPVAYTSMATPDRAYTSQPPDKPNIGGLAQRVQQVNPGQPVFLNDYTGCFVCAEEAPNTIVLFPCGHGVCDECATKLTVVNKIDFTCPMCRTPVLYADLVSYQLSRQLCDKHGNVMNTLNKLKDLTPDRIADASIPPNHGPIANFGVASAPGEIATIIAVPPVDASQPATPKKAIVYLLDTSGSFQTELPKVIAALHSVLEAHIGGYFACITFNCDATIVVQPHRVTENSIPETMAALYAVKASGSTMLDLGLLLAEEVSQAMGKLIAENGDYAVVLAHIVTDGVATRPELAAQVLGSMHTPPFVFGFGTGFSYAACDALYSCSPHSAANYVHAKDTRQLKCELLGEQCALSRVQVTCPADSRVYCNGKVTMVGATGIFATTFDPKKGIRFAVGAPAALDLVGTLTIGGCVPMVTQDPRLGFEVSHFMLAMLVLEYVMELGSKIHVDDTCTLYILLIRVRKAVCGLGPSMAEVLRVIDVQLKQVAATTNGRGRGGGNDAATDSNTMARAASSAIRCLSHA